jgi:uncharacterized protein YjbI with pentapeptide repeats
MTWERSLLRIVPALLGFASVMLALISGGGRLALFASVTFVIGLLMALAVFFNEREVKKSEERLRAKGTDSTPGTAESEIYGGPDWDAIENASSRREWLSYPDQHEKLNFDNVSVRDLSMKSLSLAEASFVGASLRDCDLSNSRLPRADFSSALLTDDLFVSAVLKSAEMKTVEARRCKFDKANLDISNWTEAVAEESSFEHASLVSAQLAQVKLEQCDLTSANAKGADLSNALLDTCIIDLLCAENTDFSRARIVNTTFDHVDLSASVIDRTVIENGEAGHASLISQLLSSALGKLPGKWIVFDTSAGYVQAAVEDQTQLRCEAVNFDTWPDWKKSRRMTKDMVKKLEELGFSLEPELNYVCFHDITNPKVFSTVGQQLATVLQDVYAVSADAPLEVTSSTFDDGAGE